MHKIDDATEVERELRRLLAYAQEDSPSRQRVAQELDQLRSRIADTPVREYAPDPLTSRAFMSEFKQGVKAGAQQARDIEGTLDPIGPYGYEGAAESLVTGAAQDLIEYMRRILHAAERSAVGVNEHRLVPKISGILSTFFYNLGKARGLRHGPNAIEEE